VPKFTDTIVVRVRAGKGGPGAVSFRREKYIPRGGPDGGDGGKGGNVYFQADGGYHNLSHLFKDRVYSAEKGKQGMGQNKHGRDGGDLVVKVPPGTQLIDRESDEVVGDLLEEGEQILVASGGIGGKGNSHFKSSTYQAPRFAQPGMPGEEKELVLNLKLIADVGLVGLPNAGKSTLLSSVTNAKPKVADYPFTTLIPNLGVVPRENGTYYKIADIPGIVEGAHRGHGLGLSFLQHIERVRVILYCIEITEQDPEYTLSLLQSELETYNPALLSRPYMILLTKSDLVNSEDIGEMDEIMKDHEVLPISSVSGNNIEKLLHSIELLLEKTGAT